MQNLTNIRFAKILTQFYIKFRDKNIRENSYMSQSTPEILRFRPIPL